MEAYQTRIAELQHNAKEFMLKGMRTNHKHEQDKKRLVSSMSDKDERIRELEEQL